MDGSLHSDLCTLVPRMPQYILSCFSIMKQPLQSWCNWKMSQNIMRNPLQKSPSFHLDDLNFGHLSWHNPSRTEHNYSYKHGSYHIQFQLHEGNSSFCCRCVGAQTHLGKFCGKQPTSYRMIFWSSAQMSSPVER